MTKSELIERVATEAKLTKGRAELVVSTIFDAMVDALRRDEGIEIRGFGTFTVRHYKPYEGRNPKTGDPVHVAPKRLPYFKIGKELRERINGQAPTDAPARKSEPARPEAPAAAPRPRPTPRPRDENVSEDVI
ncbi:MAG TPA: HU family DNA-binding protein [Nannocystaceae bacterium]|nr:HU family DNA-binding protein [Nannocystaceae bacterium]